MQNFETDVVVIGAGPAGLFSVFELGMLKLKAHVVDALDALGGQCSALYPEKPIYDIPAHPSILAQDLVDALQKQSAPFQPTYHLGQRVEKLQKTADGLQVTTSKNVQINCKAIIIAAGCGAFGPNRPPMQNLEEFENSGCVSYFVNKREDFRGKKLVIAGGGDSAVDWAISLSEIAEKISVVHRRPKFRCAPESAAKLEELAKAGKIELVIPYQLDRLEGENGKLKNVIVSTLEGEKRALPADALLPFFGLSMELGEIANWGLNLDNNHITVNQTTMQTSMDGVFAIGDIATYAGKLKLILSGFAEAATAAHSAHKICRPDEVLHFEYSTTSGVPKA